MYDEASLPPDPDEVGHPEVTSESRERPSKDTLERLSTAIELKSNAGYNFTEWWMNRLDTTTKTGDPQSIQVKWFAEEKRPVVSGQVTLGEAWVYHTDPGVEGADTYKVYRTPDGLAIDKFLGARSHETLSEDQLEAKRSSRDIGDVTEERRAKEQSIQREMGFDFVSDTEALDLAKQIEEGTSVLPKR